MSEILKTRKSIESCINTIFERYGSTNPINRVLAEATNENEKVLSHLIQKSSTTPGLTITLLQSWHKYLSFEDFGVMNAIAKDIKEIGILKFKCHLPTRTFKIHFQLT
jgi:hypothetical protein